MTNMENHHAIKNGKPSISMGHLYHGYVSHNQRVTLQLKTWWLNPDPITNWPCDWTPAIFEQPGSEETKQMARVFHGFLLTSLTMWANNPYKALLVGGIPTPLKNMLASWDHYSQYIYIIWKKHKYSKPPTSLPLKGYTCVQHPLQGDPGPSCTSPGLGWDDLWWDGTGSSAAWGPRWLVG